MLGIEDPFIWAGYLAMIACAAACVVYGALNWNKGAEEDGC